MEETKVAAMKPVAKLIGWLLLLSGVGNALPLLGWLYRCLNSHLDHTPSPLPSPAGFSFWYGGVGQGVLGLLGIVIGLGLLKLAPWSRRAALGLLLALVLYWCVIPLLPLWQTPPAPVARGIVADTFFRVMTYLIGLIMLAALPMRALWGVSRPPGHGNTLAERLLRLFPAALSPLTIFLGVTLLCLAGRNFVTHFRFFFVLPHAWLREIGQAMGLANLLGFLYMPGFLLVGALLLPCQGWGHRTGRVVLPCLALVTALQCFLSCRIMWQTGVASHDPQFIIFVLSDALTNIGILAVLSCYLWKSDPPTIAA